MPLPLPDYPTVLKWPVPVDDQPHLIGSGPVTHMVALTRDEVTVWTWHRPDHAKLFGDQRYAQVYGTGHPLPDGAIVLGTAPYFATSAVTGLYAPFVWHLVALP